MTLEPVSQQQTDQVDLVSLWLVLWRHKMVIAVCTFVCVAVAVYAALTATPMYRADAIVTEVHDSPMGGLSSLANQLGGIASLAGVSLPSGGQSQSPVPTLKSRVLAEEFIRRNDLLPVLYPDPKNRPSLWLAIKNFRQSTLVIREDKRNGTISVGINWKDPVLAARWANDYVALTNESVRSRVMRDSQRNIDYLNGQIAQTRVIEVQRVMYNIIESETKTLMLANSKPEYAFAVVDPAVAPEVRTSPRRSLMVLEGAAFGGLVGAIIAFLLDTIAAHRRKKELVGAG